jgi:hypothetical protein
LTVPELVLLASEVAVTVVLPILKFKPTPLSEKVTASLKVTLKVMVSPVL